MKHIKGFNLIELLIVVAILGIVIGIAYPNYQDYVIRARRGDAISMLLLIMQHQERFFTDRHTYTLDFTDLGFVVNASGSVETEGSFYLVASSLCLGRAINNCVMLTATPQGVQQADGALTLNSIGQRTPLNLWN